MSLSESQLYKRIKMLGEGSFGKAFLVQSHTNQSYYVIKQIDMSGLKENEKLNVIKEAKILEALKHPNIICFKDIYKTKKGKLCIVMDYADDGDLSSKIKEKIQKKGAFSENEILDWFTQICLAIKHVHDRKIIHRDIKTQNIFLTKRKIAKLGDFGIARILSLTKDKAKTMIGTPYYLAPEIIKNEPYSFSCDIWSLGVVLYELCTLKPPFIAQNLRYLVMKIVEVKKKS